MIPWYAGLADFVVQPSDPIDDLANSLKSSAFDLVDKVLHGLGSVGSFDPRDAAYYLREYGIAPDPGLLGHIEAADGPPPVVDGATLSRAVQALSKPREPAE